MDGIRLRLAWLRGAGPGRGKPIQGLQLNKTLEWLIRLRILLRRQSIILQQTKSMV